MEVGQAVQLAPYPGEQLGRVIRVLHLYEQDGAGPQASMHADGHEYEWPMVRCCHVSPCCFLASRCPCLSTASFAARCDEGTWSLGQRQEETLHCSNQSLRAACLQATVYGMDVSASQLFWTDKQHHGINLAAFVEKVEVKHCPPGSRRGPSADPQQLYCCYTWDHVRNQLTPCSA